MPLKYSHFHYLPVSKYQFSVGGWDVRLNITSYQTFLTPFFVDALVVSSKSSGEEETSGLQVAIICLLIGFLLLLIIIAFVCFKRRQTKRARKS